MLVVIDQDGGVWTVGWLSQIIRKLKALRYLRGNEAEEAIPDSPDNRE